MLRISGRKRLLALINLRIRMKALRRQERILLEFRRRIRLTHYLNRLPDCDGDMNHHTHRITTRRIPKRHQRFNTLDRVSKTESTRLIEIFCRAAWLSLLPPAVALPCAA